MGRALILTNEKTGQNDLITNRKNRRIISVIVYILLCYNNVVGRAIVRLDFLWIVFLFAGFSLGGDFLI